MDRSSTIASTRTSTGTTSQPSPHQLLEAPRGRRLCWELLAEADRSLSWPYAAEPTAAPPELLDQIGSIAARHRSWGQDELHRVLAATVDNARYWQEPDEVDRLITFPEVRDALAPVAQSVLDSEAGRSWSAGPTTPQWWIDWREPGDPAPLPSTTPATLRTWIEETRADESRAERERPADPQAAWSGEWWSLPTAALTTVGRLPEALDLVEDSFGEDTAVAVPVYGAGRTWTITGPQDWVQLCERHPLEVTSSRRHDWFRTTGRNGAWVIPDWASVAQEWDAVHLTIMGYLLTAGRALDLPDGPRATVLAGFNPGTTLWLDDVLRERPEAEAPRVTWTRGPDGDGVGHWSADTHPGAIPAATPTAAEAR